MSPRASAASGDALATCPTCQRPIMAVRLALAAGTCPLCWSGPYRVPLSHIARVHKLDRFEARTLFGLGRSELVCDPAHSQRARASAIARGFGVRTTKET